jgi:hypothetical protein
VDGAALKTLRQDEDTLPTMPGATQCVKYMVRGNDQNGQESFQRHHRFCIKNVGTIFMINGMKNP